MDTTSFGENVLQESPVPSSWYFFVAQLKSPLVYILLVAALVTVYLRDYIDAGVILLAVLTNTILGFIQERKAHHSLRSLQQILTPTARVLRGGKATIVDARTISVDDMVFLKSGDRVPADGQVIESVDLYINEATLTGESQPVEKSLKTDANVYAGTVVTSGRATCRVTAIGMNTRLGAIAQTLEETHEEQTPLQQELSALARMLAMTVVCICIVIFFIGVIKGLPTVTMFSLAVAIAVAAIPEGMLVTLTAILSVGMQRILKRHAIVRRLIAAETLGGISVLCVDKTGTLTQGVMQVAAFSFTDKTVATHAAVFANNLENPIDIALWEWVQSQDHDDPQQWADENPRTGELPFDGAKKYMAVANAQGIWIKGAPEILLAQSALSTKERNAWIVKINTYAKKGLRLIGLAWKKSTTRSSTIIDIHQLTFLGVIAVSDPLRVHVAESLALCQSAGVRVKVITGDYRLTSETILKQLGIPIRYPQREIIEGKELADLSVDDLANRIQDVRLFCRVTPQQKLKIVEALQNTGEIVAMTGDGVNDALALKKADIGIVVAGASDVARETADLVLLDSNFQTIVAAIEEGRVMFENIRKVVLYLLSDAFTEIFLIVGSILSNVPLPLTAIQILWINILSDGFPNLALSMEPKEHDVMRHPPRTRNIPILNTKLRIMSLGLSATKALVAFAIFMGALKYTGSLAYAQTLTFAVVGSGSLMYVFSTRNLFKAIWKDNPMKNPWLILAVIAGFFLQLLVIYEPHIREAFHTHPLGLWDWVIVFYCGFLLIGVSEGLKHINIR